VKKNKIESKKKHPLRKSLCQSFLLAIALGGLLLIIDYFDENGFVSQDTNFMMILFVIGIVGSVLIFKKNYTTRSYMKIFILASIVVITISGVSIFSYESKRLEQLNISICGSDGDLYYCGSEEPITCDGGNYAVRNDDGYKCIDSDKYRHDILGEEYDYTCIGKYEEEDIHQNAVTSLMLDEKVCLEKKIEAAIEPFETKKQDIESKFDIRDKVKVIAGDQGSSDTCEIWSSTKALEISAQLKGLDYQFLIDFEKKINGLDANIDGIINEEDNTILLGSDHLIPGKKKYYYLSYESEKGEDYETIAMQRSYGLTNLLDKYSKILSLVHADKSEYNIFDDIPNAEEYEKELLNLYTKELVKKYGSAFIKMRDDIQPGHRMLIIGWDDSKESWLVLNSWGNTWARVKYFPDSNGDGTVWIKYTDENFLPGSANTGGNAIELISE